MAVALRQAKGTQPQPFHLAKSLLPPGRLDFTNGNAAVGLQSSILEDSHYYEADLNAPSSIAGSTGSSLPTPTDWSFVTRNTSSGVVIPCCTKRHPSSASTRMPARRAASRNTSADA